MTIETRASWAVCLTALAIAAVSFAAPAITVVGLKSIAADLVLAVPCDRETHGGDITLANFASSGLWARVELPAA